MQMDLHAEAHDDVIDAPASVLSTFAGQKRKAPESDLTVAGDGQDFLGEESDPVGGSQHRGAADSDGPCDLPGERTVGPPATETMNASVDEIGSPESSELKNKPVDTGSPVLEEGCSVDGGDAMNIDTPATADQMGSDCPAQEIAAMEMEEAAAAQPQQEEHEAQQPAAPLSQPPSTSQAVPPPGDMNDPVVRALNKLISPSGGGGITDVKHLSTLLSLLEVCLRVLQNIQNPAQITK